MALVTLSAKKKHAVTSWEGWGWPWVSRIGHLPEPPQRVQIGSGAVKRRRSSRGVMR